MNFLQPTFLWTLTAIAVPLAIHLLSRKEGKIVKVGSLRHMEASTTSRFKSLRLNEVWLLIARCLMITWMALFLSGASCSSKKSGVDWLLTEQGMDADSRVAPLIDSLTDAGFEWRTLADGFPKYAPAQPDAQQPDYRALAEELSQKSDHNVIVISYNLVDGFRQMRMPLPENVRWIPVDPLPQEFQLMASRLGADSVLVRAAKSSSTTTSYVNQRTAVSPSQDWFVADGYSDSVHIEAIDTIRYVVVNDSGYEEDARVLKAAIQAVAGIEWVEVKASDADLANWQFWLQEGEPLRPFSTRTILMKPSPSLGWFTRIDTMEWHLNRRVTADDALKDHLAVELARTFASELASHSPGYKKDARSMPDAIAWSSGSIQAAENITAQDASLWLVILFGLTWAIERILAVRKNL